MVETEGRAWRSVRATERENMLCLRVKRERESELNERCSFFSNRSLYTSKSTPLGTLLQSNSTQLETLTLLSPILLSPSPPLPLNLKLHSMATEDIDYYGLLELPQTATLQEIKTAYRKKSLKVHPDRVRCLSLSLPHSLY